jgi:ABC-type uncharacterized transport system substrate-binding protein
MRWRQFITLLGGATAWPLAARAQPTDQKRRIGGLMNGAEDEPESLARIASFQQGLADLGWVIGRNIEIHYHWRTGDVTRSQAAASQVVHLAPDVILANGTAAMRALRNVTRIPIVFTLVSEPVDQGFVDSLSRPGGNVTGFSNLEPTVAAKLMGGAAAGCACAAA